MGNAKSELDNSNNKNLTQFQLNFNILKMKLARIQSLTQQYTSSDPSDGNEHDNRLKGRCYKHEKIALLKMLDNAEKLMVECKEMDGGMIEDWYPYEKAVNAIRKNVMLLQEKEDLTDLNILPDPPEYYELGLDD